MGEKSKVGLNHNEADGVCPFCAEHFKKYHPKPILKETDYWFLTENMSPYEGAAQHFLFVYKPAHINTFGEVDVMAAQDLFALLTWVTETYRIEGGSFFMRFGNMAWNGSSVEHLHAQLIVGKKKDATAEALRVKLGWKV
jgi:diadenosine tetraphosphate (Ap4A) HIT family hydrolase